MGKGKRRRILRQGDTTSYKLPVIKGEEGERFYSWLNNPQKSINGIITEALKLKYTVDNMDIRKKDHGAVSKESNDSNEIVEAEKIDVFNEENSSSNNDSVELKAIMRTINSVKR